MSTGSFRINEQPITAVQDLPLWQHAKPRNTGSREYIPSPPPTDAQLRAAHDYANHSTARQGAARRGAAAVISAEQANTMRIASVESNARGTQAAIEASALATITNQLAVVLDALARNGEALSDQGQRIESLSARLDVLDGASAEENE